MPRVISLFTFFTATPPSYYCNISGAKRKVILLPHSCDIMTMIAASNVLVLPRARKGSLPYERMAATLKVPTIMRGFDDPNYIPDYNCYLYSDDINELAETIHSTFTNKEKRVQLGQKAWETLTVSKEENVKELENAYRQVIRRYYETTRK